ncbi:MAG: nitroreductase family protein [Clostridia bacterium]|nr:nitroreductase family protein [Clostridia bacterium]
MSLKRIRNYIGEFRAYNRERKQVVEAAVVEKQGRLIGRIVRYVHSIEKGLSIESPRAEFGYEKIMTMHGWILEYLQLNPDDKTCVYMAADALIAYCAYHDSIGVSSDKVNEIRDIARELQAIKHADGVTGIFGGVQTIHRENMTFDQATVEAFFKTRHSIRQFKKESIERELILRAVEWAQCAPSACNRQAVRAYAMDTEKFLKNYPDHLQGVGGFIDSCDKVIVITGKISPYEEAEYKQFVVSAGIFTGYLTLALHGLGLGACVVQRSLRPSEDWMEFARKNGIPTDEQVICLVVVGQMNEETVVPLSKRFETDTILKWL